MCERVGDRAAQRHDADALPTGRDLDALNQSHPQRIGCIGQFFPMICNLEP